MAIIVFQHHDSEGPGRLGATLRDHGEVLDIRRPDRPEEAGGGRRAVPVDFDDVDAVISLGGPMNVGDRLGWMQAELDFLAEAHRRRLPVVGICLGAQMLAAALGGEVGPMESGEGRPGVEFGFGGVSQTPAGNTDTVLAGIPWRTWMFQTHAQEVKTPPAESTVLQSSDACRVQCFRAGMRSYGFQYHFEYDRPMIERQCRMDGSLIGRAGVSIGDVMAQADRHYESFARLGARMSVNIAAFLFPVGREMTA